MGRGYPTSCQSSLSLYDYYISFHAAYQKLHTISSSADLHNRMPRIKLLNPTTSPTCFDADSSLSLPGLEAGGKGCSSDCCCVFYHLLDQMRAETWISCQGYFTRLFQVATAKSHVRMLFALPRDCDDVFIRCSGN